MECGDGRGNPKGASLDRIDSRGTYSLLNVRLVCWRVNQMKNDMAECDFLEWVRLISQKSAA